MTFKYREFVSNIKTRGLAVQNRFWVMIPAPKILSRDNKDIAIFCKSVNLPGVNIASTSERLTGEVREIPYDRNFGPASFLFWNRSDFDTREYFERWIDGIQDPTTRILSYYNDIKSDIVVTVLDKMDKPQFKVTLLAAHPKSVGSLVLDNEMPGAMQFDVQFDYHHYKLEKL